MLIVTYVINNVKIESAINIIILIRENGQKRLENHKRSFLELKELGAFLVLIFVICSTKTITKNKV